MADHIRTVCQICGCNCGLVATIENGQLVKVKGDPLTPQNKGGMCIKGKLSPRIVYSPDRIVQPLKRKGNGSGFKAIGWNEALGEISSRLQVLKETHGPQSLAIYRGRSTRFIDRAFIAAFARLYGTPNVTGVWTLCVGPKVIGYQATFGMPLFPRCDFKNAKLIVLWGTNPAATKMHRYFQVPHDIRGAVKNGAELVVVDPRRHRFAAEATQHLAVTPGTDTFLIMALAKILIEENLIDRNYIRKYTKGFKELSAAVKKVDLKAAADVTGISMETISSLARKLGTIKPVSIDRREGVIHQVNGTQINRALAILTAITGNVDIPGGLSFNESPVWNSTLGIENPIDAPAIWKETYPLAADGAQALPDAILDDNPYPVKSLISISGNPVSALPHTGRTLKALKKLDLLVVSDLFMSETAQLADFVLPGVTFYEKGEFHTEPLKPVPWLQTTEPLIHPVGDAKPEWRIMAELSEHLGFRTLSGYSNEDDILKRVFKDSGRPDLDPKAMRKGIQLGQVSFERQLEKGFNTSSGKIELHSGWLAKYGYPPLPKAEDVCSCTDQFPYRLVTGARVDPFNHSQHRNIPDLLKRSPCPEAEIPSEMSDQLNVSNGDRVSIETKIGILELKARIIDGMNRVTVSIPHGWPGKKNANWLVGDDLRDAISGTPAYKAIPCRVRKVDS